MIEILAAAGGAIARLAPEVLGFLDKKNERQHELDMQDKQIELARLQQSGQLAVADIQAQSQFNTSALQALADSVKAQATPTGVKWVDALSATVRPVVTYLIVGLYASTKLAEQTPLWTEFDGALLSSTLAFWFVGRVLDRVRVGRP